MSPCTTSRAPTSRRSRSISPAPAIPRRRRHGRQRVGRRHQCDDQINVALVGAAVAVTGTFAPVTIDHADAFDTLVVNGFVGDDVINAAKLPATAMQLTLEAAPATTR